MASRWSSSDREHAVTLIQAAVVAKSLRVFKKAVKHLQGKDEGIVETISRVHDKFGTGVLHWAAGQGRREICQYLIEELGFDVNLATFKNGMTPLMYACSGPLATFEGSLGDCVSAIQYLIDQGADIAIRDKKGDTALHLAIRRGNAEALKILVSNGYPLDEPSNHSGPPLLMTALAQSECLMKILLDHKADPNVVHGDFITPLLMSAVNNALDCAKLLIKYGADANKMNILYWTAFGGSKEMLEVLLNGGADPNIPNEYGRFPVEIAAIRGSRDLVELLFPLTSPIPTLTNWSVDSLFRHVNSASFKREEENLLRKRMKDMKQKIEDALSQEDSLSAFVHCTQASHEDPRDTSIYANRSKSFLLSGNFNIALQDAFICMHLKPKWAISYLRLGAALRSLKKYKDAIVVLIGGVGLDPSNEDIQNELWATVKSAKKASRK